ncbi:TetR/AcrR family transcriptional regulator [Solimonas sp. SE-A11]|uniref:TetR/AcrR family transcriptional regulator n=1 Tax=Solimonas sp. SE-A11 TaxID=3054954 RepID=UPI00259D1F68|nr:TetR/AcrR family transcriptional regulator [Solimonas sp. SE-A11]MDM4769802.1 helix-turn-helix domain-containing protein [Solimonas sp. SE-A11]
MSRLKQTEEVRQRVVRTAQRLFLERGYMQTTLREISAAAGVSYGSLYHHFADKEGIFLELVLDGFEKNQQAADHQLNASQDSHLRLGLKWGGLVQAASDDVRVAELLSVAYRSWKITDVLMKAATARHQEWLKAELPDWSENQFLAATFVLKGAVASIVEEKLNLDRLTTHERIRAVLAAALPSFGANREKTLLVIERVQQLSAPLAKAAIAEAITRSGRGTRSLARKT